jgi:branched-chain amino acid aminotransferase
VDKLSVGAGKIGPVTKALQDRYLATVKGQAADSYGWLTRVQAGAGAGVAASR